MEDQRFDQLTKVLARSVSRRAALKAAVATTIGGFFVVRTRGIVAADECKCFGVKCNHDHQCCTSRCDPTTKQCVCPTGATLCNGVCTPNCSGGQVLNANTCQCACTSGTVLCNGSCVSICPSGQTLNASSCQCDCPTGKTKCGSSCCTGGQTCTTNQQCVSVECGTTCPANQQCGGRPSCRCFNTAEGPCTCVEFFNASCGDPACTTSADCPAGAVCLATTPSPGGGTGCEHGICRPVCGQQVCFCI